MYTHGKHRQDLTIQLNFLEQPAMSRCEGFLTFQELTPSQSSGCAHGFYATKPPAHPEDGDGVSS
jgi:hypothetical protein